jgi:pimeloyl-ACP methyl ester carboxylesterase
LAATQRPFAARCLTDKAPAAIGWKTIPSWYVIGNADKVIPPDILNKFAIRAKSKVYHVPGGDHPSMIAHPEVTVAAIEDARPN